VLYQRLLFSISLLLLLAKTGQSERIIIPVTYLLDDSGVTEVATIDPDLTSFVLSIYDPFSPDLEGVYIKDKFQMPITPQPANNPGFVTNSADTITNFSIAKKYGSIGLIAHNHLAGEAFFELEPGDEISLVYGNGQIEKFVVTEIRAFRALSPTSPYSSFIDLANPGAESISYQELFDDTYGIRDRLVLQTCISKGNLDSWGRLFVIASPVDSN